MDLKGIGEADFYEADRERKIEILGYIFNRRDDKGFMDSLSGYCPRDEIFLANMRTATKPSSNKGTGDAKLDAFNSFLSKE
jgi:hypothetical protein